MIYGELESMRRRINKNKENVFKSAKILEELVKNVEDIKERIEKLSI